MPPKITPQEIEIFTQGKWRPNFFIRHVCSFLRTDPQLLKNSDYQRLYQETLDYQYDRAIEKYGWREEKRKDGFRFFEILADLIAEDASAVHFTAAQIDAFLAHRRKIWDNE